MVRQKVIVMYGGQSTEHEISKRSARFVFKHIDTEKYDLVPIGVTKEGRWCLQDLRQIMADHSAPLEIIENEEPIDFINLAMVKDTSQPAVAIPIMHGSFGEDGCTQGLLELNSLAYVGPGVLGSALAMDKVVAKTLVSAAGVPVVPSVSFIQDQWCESSQDILDRIQTELTFPLYVKPANLGSSVGISKVDHSQSLKKAIEDALGFDYKILVETGMDVREIEFAALGGYVPRISAPGEVVACKGFYSYESKYQDPDASKILIPAPMSPDLLETGKSLASKVFQALNLYGMSRLDFFLEKTSNKFYFNEANTLPGLTSISQYPQLWQHEGISGSQLIDCLISDAIIRWKQQHSLRRSYS